IWPRTTGARIDHGPMPIGCGRTAPPHWESPRPPSWWGLAFTLGADASLLGSLIFGAIFLVTIAPGPAPTEILPAGIATTLVAVAAMALAAALAELGVRSARVGTRSPQGPLAGAALCQLVALVALAVLITDLPAPTRHSYAAAALVLVAYAGLHAAIGLIFSAWAWSRCLAGYVSAARTLDLRLCAMWQVYTAVAGAGVLFVLHAVSAGLRS
ncbi:MAG: cytochrome, partial [Hyphomicrobiales bacterium]|nr:cytochrome [Hyphomicrobiales bacterium]